MLTILSFKNELETWLEENTHIIYENFPQKSHPYLIFADLGFEFRASHLVGRHPTIWDTGLVPEKPSLKLEQIESCVQLLNLSSPLTTTFLNLPW
jgi:hypothetical protein